LAHVAADDANKTEAVVSALFELLKVDEHVARSRIFVGEVSQTECFEGVVGLPRKDCLS
jgi:hypothetical protein